MPTPVGQRGEDERAHARRRRARRAARGARASLELDVRASAASAVKIAVPVDTATAETISAPAGRGDRGDHRGQQRAGDEDQLDHRRVQRVGRLVQARLEQVRPHASAGRMRSAGSRTRPRSRTRSSTTVGRAELGEADDRAQRDGVDDRDGQQHPPRAEPVDEPALDRRADRRAGASEPDTAPATANEPVCSRRYSTIASALMPIGSRASSDEATSAPTCGERRISR